MALTAAVVNAGVDAAAALLAWASMHTADPGGTGANEVVGGGYARQPVTWDPATGQVAAMDGTLPFTGPSGGAATHVGLWSAVTAGTWRGGDALTGDQTFNAAGEYEITSLTVTGTAS